MRPHHHVCELCRIELDHLSVSMDGQTLLQNIDLHIHCGELTVLIGANGAGKTTLLRALLGELPYQGEVRHVRHDGSSMRAVLTGYVPQQMVFDHSTPVTVLDFLVAGTGGRAVWRGVRKADREAALAALRATHCEALADRRLGALSGGELQRVLLALALTPSPDLLILDEPVSGVDHNGLEQFYRTVAELRQARHLAVLLVSHDFDVVRRYADRAVLIRRTVLDEGTPEQVFSGVAFAREFAGASALQSPHHLRTVQPLRSTHPRQIARPIHSVQTSQADTPNQADTQNLAGLNPSPPSLAASSPPPPANPQSGGVRP